MSDLAPCPPGRLDRRVAVVTGAARGLGRAIVERLAAAGAVGAAFDLPAALADASLPDRWTGVAADVRDEAGLAAAFATVDRVFGRLDIVVANAGIVPPWRESAEIDLDEWDTVFAINVRGVIATIKHAVPALRRNGGAVVAMASLNAWRAHGRQCLYTASKHAVLGIVRATALDLGRYNIRVNAVGPGPVATEALLERMRWRESQGGLTVEAALQAAGDNALGRMVTAGNVADSVLFLASDLSAGMTGIMLPVDGGVS